MLNLGNVLESSSALATAESGEIMINGVLYELLSASLATYSDAAIVNLRISTRSDIGVGLVRTNVAPHRELILTYPKIVHRRAVPAILLCALGKGLASRRGLRLSSVSSLGGRWSGSKTFGGSRDRRFRYTANMKLSKWIRLCCRAG